jgi:predicted nucleic acid-binding protein
MIALDANVLSEPMAPHPEPRVLEWLRGVPSSTLCTTSTVLSELMAGVAALPAGRRRAHLQDQLDLAIDEDLAGRVLPFDAEAARAYAAVTLARRHQGRPIGVADAQIAAVCLVHDAALATRNVRDFAELGLALIDPWESTAG